MILEVLLIFPLYAAGIFILFFRFRRIIKAMTEIDEIFSAMSSEDDEVSKRGFLVEKIKNGETISNSHKNPWTVERLEKASDKVVDKLYEKYVNPPPVKVSKQEALEMGKPVCPVVIEMYAEGLKSLMVQMPYVGGRYTVNAEKLKANISANKLFCDNLAVKIGSKMIKQMDKNSVTHVGVSLAAMTWNAVERVESNSGNGTINERRANANLLPAGEPLEGAKGDN